MAAVNTASDALHWLHTGAAVADGTQRDAAACLGGLRSVSRVPCMTIHRPSALANIRVDHIGGALVAGTGMIEVSDTDTVKYTPPNGTQGAGVSIAQGATVMVPDDSGDSHVVLSRLASGELGGAEALGQVDTLNNAIGGGSFSAAEATSGANHYRGLILQNKHSADGMTGLTVWLDSGMGATVAVASETVSSDAIQTIADESTAPTGRTWETGTTEGTGLVLGAVAAGSGVGLWIRTTIAASAAAAAKVDVVLHYSYTISGTKYTGSVRGLHHVENTNAAPYELYLETSEPDPAADTAVATSADGDFDYATGGLTVGTYYWGVWRRNAYGLLSPASDIQRLEIDSGGNEIGTPPIGPELIQITATADGAFLVEAEYLPTQEGDSQAAALAQRADTWLIYASYNGTDPDPATDTPIEVAMAHSDLYPELLSYTTATQMDQAPGRFIVRTRRTDGGDTYDSEDSTIATGTAEKLGPGRTAGSLLVGRDHGVPLSPETSPGASTVWIDQPNNIYWDIDDGDVSLYADSVLVWRRLDVEATQILYVPSGFDLVSGGSTAAGSSDVVEVLSWTAGDKRLSLNANGTRVVEIDVTNMTITAPRWRFSEAVEDTSADDPAWPRYMDSLFVSYDPPRETFEAYAMVETDGDTRIAVYIDHTLAQAAVEVL